MTFDEFCDWTGMDVDDVVTPTAWADFINQDRPICDWWAEFQGLYV